MIIACKDLMSKKKKNVFGQLRRFIDDGKIYTQNKKTSHKSLQI